MATQTPTPARSRARRRAAVLAGALFALMAIPACGRAVASTQAAGAHAGHEHGEEHQQDPRCVELEEAGDWVGDLERMAAVSTDVVRLRVDRRVEETHLGEVSDGPTEVSISRLAEAVVLESALGTVPSGSRVRLLVSTAEVGDDGKPVLTAGHNAEAAFQPDDEYIVGLSGPRNDAGRYQLGGGVLVPTGTGYEPFRYPAECGEVVPDTAKLAQQVASLDASQILQQVAEVRAG